MKSLITVGAISLYLFILSGNTFSDSADREYSPVASALYEAIEAGNTEAMAEALTSLFDAEDVRLPHALSWHFQEFDAPINYYNAWDQEVHLSRMPAPEQAAAYWGMWSMLLTDGRFDAEAFFRDTEEAHILAAFNQTVLAAHELGHGLAYYYAVNPQWIDGSVNCQELLADRVAAGVVHTLAASDDRFAELRARYLALITEIQSHISPELRVDEADLSDCSSLHVDQPASEPQFVRYASAFFARQGQLLDPAEPLLLARVLAEHITHAWIDYSTRYPAGYTDYHVRTVSPAAFTGDEVSSSYRYFLSFIHGEDTLQAVAFHLDGQQVQVNLRAQPPEEGSQLWVADRVGNRALTLLPELPDGYLVLERVAAGPGGALTLLVVHEPLDDEESPALYLIGIDPSSDVARVGPALPLDIEQEPALISDPEGQQFVVTPQAMYRVNQERLTIEDPILPRPDAPGVPLAVDSEGRLYFIDNHAIGRQVTNFGLMTIEPGGGVLLRGDAEETIRVAGTGFAFSADDGPVHEVNLGDIVAFRVSGDTLQWLEQTGSDSEPFVLREAVAHP